MTHGTAQKGRTQQHVFLSRKIRRAQGEIGNGELLFFVGDEGCDVVIQVLYVPPGTVRYLTHFGATVGTFGDALRVDTVQQLGHGGDVSSAVLFEGFYDRAVANTDKDRIVRATEVRTITRALQVKVVAVGIGPNRLKVGVKFGLGGVPIRIARSLKGIYGRSGW